MPIQWCFLNILYTPSTQSSIPITIRSVSQTTNFCFPELFYNGLVTDPPLSNFAPLKSHLPATSRTILSQMSKFCLTQALFKIFPHLHICHRTMVKLQNPCILSALPSHSALLSVAHRCYAPLGTVPTYQDLKLVLCFLEIVWYLLIKKRTGKLKIVSWKKYLL